MIGSDSAPERRETARDRPRARTQRVALSPRRSDERERMDEVAELGGLLDGALDDLRRVNRWLGGTRLTLRGLERLAATHAPGAELSVLDVGTGAGDIPRAIVEWAHRRGLRPRVVATDVAAELLDVARHGDAEGVEFALADARSLPFSDRSFDVAACSLFLHHFGPEEAVAVLREMRRVARVGVVVNDLVRGWIGYAGAYALSRICTSNPVTRHDAPLSVRRAYTRAEMARLATLAELRQVEFSGWLGYRVAMTAER